MALTALSGSSCLSSAFMNCWRSSGGKGWDWQSLSGYFGIGFLYKLTLSSKAISQNQALNTQVVVQRTSVIVAVVWACDAQHRSGIAAEALWNQFVTEKRQRRWKGLTSGGRLGVTCALPWHIHGPAGLVFLQGEDLIQGGGSIGLSKSVTTLVSVVIPLAQSAWTVFRWLLIKFSLWHSPRKTYYWTVSPDCASLNNEHNVWRCFKAVIKVLREE